MGKIGCFFSANVCAHAAVGALERQNASIKTDHDQCFGVRLQINRIVSLLWLWCSVCCPTKRPTHNNIWLFRPTCHE